jgi:hypothetical protein
MAAASCIESHAPANVYRRFESKDDVELRRLGNNPQPSGV